MELLPSSLRIGLPKSKLASLYQKKFEAYRTLSTLSALACAFLGLSLLSWDYAVDPAHVADTVLLRFLLGASILPLGVYIHLARWRAYELPVFTAVIIISEMIFVLTMNQLDNGHALGSGAFIYWFLFVPIMGAGFSLRTNIFALFVIPFPPLIMYLAGYAPNLPVAVHIVYSVFSFIVVSFVVFLSNRLIINLLVMQEDLAAARDKAVALAHTDPLTGVNNRRAFFLNAAKALAHARRYKQPLSVVMLDIDHFKVVNDTHGHAAGDEVLKKIAGLCQQAFREVDIIGRMGGEEFAVLLVGASGEDALPVIERLRINIVNARTLTDGKQVSVTASFGISEYERGDQTIEKLLSKADDALYIAKKQGRNRVIKAENS